MDFAGNVARVKGDPAAAEKASAPTNNPAGRSVRVDPPGNASQAARGTGTPSGSAPVPAADPVVAAPAPNAGGPVPSPVVAAPVGPAGATPSPIVVPQPPVGATGAPQESGPVIELSAGTALPQTLPQGTVMTFAVDYRFAQGGPEPGGRYVWVVEGGGKAERAGIPRLDGQGQLPAFLSRILTPNDGPFRCWIEEWPRAATSGRPVPGRRISNVAPLQ
jgi:hypothetical protein